MDLISGVRGNQRGNLISGVRGNQRENLISGVGSWRCGLVNFFFFFFYFSFLERIPGEVILSGYCGKVPAEEAVPKYIFEDTFDGMFV